MSDELKHPGSVLIDAARQPRPLKPHLFPLQTPHPLAGGASEGERKGLTPVVHPSQTQDVNK